MKRYSKPFKNILIISKPITPPWNDSAKNLVKTLIDHITGYSFNVFTTQGFDYPKDNIVSEKIYKGGIGYQLSVFDKLKTFLRLFAPDSNLSCYHMFFAPYPLAILALKVIAKIKRKKIIFSICSLPKKEDTLKNLRFADKVVALSVHTKGILEKSGLSAAYIPPAIDISSLDSSPKIEAVKKRLGLREKRIILYAGDYETLVNNEYLISSIRDVVAKSKDLNFVFACRVKTETSKIREESLKNDVAQSGLSEYTTFLNEVSDMHDLIASSTISIFPVLSTYRKMDIPLILIESLAYGIPLIIPDIAPVNEIYKADVGIKIDLTNPFGLSKAISDLLKDPKQYSRISENAKSAALKYFDAPVMADGYAGLYDNIFSRKNNIDYYDEFSFYYDKRRQNPYHRFIDEITADISEKYVENKNVLEVGCGTGRMLEKLKEKGAKLIGVDLSSNMLKPSIEKGFLVNQGSATELPFKDNSFDTAVSYKVLAHIPDIERAVSEMARAVKPGGHLILEFYNPYSIRGLIKHLKPHTKISTKIHDENVYIRYDSIKSIKSYLKKNLDIVEIRGTRILILAGFLMKIPILSSILRWLDRLLSNTPLKYMAGFLIVVAKKRPD